MITEIINIKKLNSDRLTILSSPLASVLFSIYSQVAIAHPFRFAIASFHAY
ncbi:hypothetical protein [Okeania sp.]|uniref:hypothetical protein n=1 Tax=Okeania sp. TaxID=3100323 RepID=UPI002B4B3959|nr:hypothetical protein [Okeania sp.]MEB3340795.1 hypothetical protein [Okeania sp.]